LFFDPGKYIVISVDASLSNYYNISTGLVIRPIPSLSNTGDDVKLKDNSNRTIDSLKYLPAWGGTNGKSLERKYEDSLSTKQTNWGTSTSPNRATPGLFNSISPLPYNLYVEILSHTPSIPVRNDSVSVTIRINNVGRNTARDFVLEIYNDFNLDNSTEESEKFFSKSFTSLTTMASVQTFVKFFASVVRIYRITAKVIFMLDEKLSDNINSRDIAVIEIPAYQNEIVINEIMYAPAGDEPEWIELFNHSNRALNLKDWKLGDNSALATLSSNDFILNSGEYLIVASEPSINNYYTITSKFLIKALPGFSNSGDEVRLKDNANRIIDSLKYLSSLGGTGGKSLERKFADSLTNNRLNWGSSISKLRATPGILNSITPRGKELAIKNFRFKNKHAYNQATSSATFWVINKGLLTAENYQWNIYNDLNKDEQLTNNELVISKSGTSINSIDSLQIEFTLTNYLPGENIIYVVIDYPGDEFLENNQASARIIGVTPTETRGDLLVNEIMFAPISPEPEWIEIFNKSAKSINLKGYQIADDANKSTFIKSDFIIAPDSFAVIARDSNIIYYYSYLKKFISLPFPSLNNNGDRLMLLDSLDRTIDSVVFKSTWGGTLGKSLERVESIISSTDSINWRSSAALRGTPGKINTRSRKNFNVALTLPGITPSKPKIGNPVSIIVAVSNPGKDQTHATFRLKLYELFKNGSRLLLMDKQADIPSSGDVIYYNTDFEYKIDFLQKPRLFEYFADYPQDEDTTNNRLQIKVIPCFNKNDVVINEIMYNPINGEPEWIELYNNSNYDIDLDGWFISDLLTTPLKTKLQSITFPKNSFGVIAKDSSIMSYHQTIPSTIIESQFANLNNDAEGVVIKDPYNDCIDSVLFDKSWGGENGKSLERKQIIIDSANKNNWGSSQDIELSTPGRRNSITPFNNDLALTEIIFTPANATSNDDVNLIAKVMNKGLNTAPTFIVEFYLINGNDTIYFSSGNGSNLARGDTARIISTAKMKLDNPKTICAKIKYLPDEVSTNNILVTRLSAGFQRSAIAISEIMYNPFDGESEWVEIINLSNAPVNLRDWKVSDLIPSLNKVNITNGDVLLLSGEYAILTPDTFKFPYYPPDKFFQVKFSSLGNTSDGFIIFDFLGNAIDSIIYNSRWGGIKGCSIERISYANSGTDSTNWTTSINKFGATPGITNSFSNIPAYTKGAVIINEIFFDPESNNSEFLEFYNTSSDSIQVGGMKLSNKDDVLFISPGYFKVPPKSYFVLAQDSTIYNNYPSLKLTENFVLLNSSLSLANTGSKLVIKDGRATTLDSVNYSPNWHNRNLISTKNRSLERINPALGSNDISNWSTSVTPEGASPGKPNSIFTETFITESKVTVSPNPFSPDNDGFEDFTTISFNLSTNLAQVRIKVFDSVGRHVRTIADNKPSGPSNSIIFDGLDDNGRQLRMGIYILLIEIVKENGNSEVLKLPVVVARKL
jgi:hypothetical protein